VLNLPFGGYVMEHFLEPVFGDRLHHSALSSGGKVVLGLIATAAALTGIAIAYLTYLRKKLRPVEPAVLQHAWYVDDLYSSVVGEGGRKLADVATAVDHLAVDREVVDGAVNGAAALVAAGGRKLRTVQSGFVRNYALAIGAGAVLMLGFVLSRT
jgi:NADH-quinone oxidoreductase subunit L